MGADKFRLDYKELDYSVSIDDIKRLDGGDDWGKEVIGQPRALEALTMGIAIKAKGYNLFVTGAPGTGRGTAVKQILENYKTEKLELKDYAYVYDFKAPLIPKALVFQPGKAKLFKKAIHDFVEQVKKLLAIQAESPDFKKEKQEIISSHESAESQRLSEFEDVLLADGFKIVQLEEEGGGTSTDIYPVFNDEPLPFDALEAKLKAGEMSQEDLQFKRESYFGHVDSMRALFIELRRGRGELEKKLEKLYKDSLAPLINTEIERIQKNFPQESHKAWLDDLARDVKNHLYLFQPMEEKKKNRPSPLSRYGVNILLDSSSMDRAPVIFESNPRYSSLVGFVEQDPRTVSERFAYLKIRPGSILRANGGFLVLQLEELLQYEESWQALKRVLRTGKLGIEPQNSPFGLQLAIKPEALDVNVKLILIGGEATYDVLYQTDPDFEKLFKICAEFDSSMSTNDESLREYIAFIHKIINEESLRKINNEGIAAVIEYGIRLSEYNNRLTTRFSKIADILMEADYRAGKAGRKLIDKEAVDAAERARSWLADLPEEKLANMIISGEIIMRVEGKCVGRVNGLAVHDRGYYAFGLPAVISAQVSPGESGVINIEGESGLSGEIYDKAVLIVEGFLRSRYARTFPLAVSASICFEQSYTAVEGDSASSTAVYALLSAIAKVPLRQDIAVTGSMNQMGQIQPVGGISEKVEGFFQICKKAGFTGSQGVMVPRQNIPNLTLEPEVLRAIRKKQFHIWAVSTIDEGMEVLSGINPGETDRDGLFTKGSFNEKVALELKRMADTIKEYLK